MNVLGTGKVDNVGETSFNWSSTEFNKGPTTLSVERRANEDSKLSSTQWSTWSVPSTCEFNRSNFDSKLQLDFPLESWISEEEDENSLQLEENQHPFSHN